jgi:L-rhamnose mutarotase
VEHPKWHDENWPEPRAAGGSDDSIFLDEETLTLFAVQKLSDDNIAVTRHPSRVRLCAHKFMM